MPYRRSRTRTPNHFARPAEILESRTLLAAVVDSISIDGQAPRVLGEVNGVELLALSDDDSTRLFTSDGTQAGTVELSDIPIESILEYQLVGQNLFLIGPNGNRVDLWSTNGQDDGAVLVKSDVSFRTDIESDTYFEAFNGELYFGAVGDDESIGTELFKSDGGPAELIADLAPGFREVSLDLPSDRGAHFEIWINRHDLETRELVSGRFINEVNIAAANNTYDVQLPDGHYRYWIRPTDAEGNEGEWSEVQTANVFDRVRNSSPRDFTVFNNELHFSASSSGVRELWKTDGTGAGTVRVDPIDPTIGEEFKTGPTSFVEFEGQLFFSSGTGLSRTDGTSILEVDLQGDVSDSLTPVAAANGHLFIAGFGQSASNQSIRVLQSLSSVTDTTLEELHSVPSSVSGPWVNGFSRFDSFAVIDDELAFLSVEVTGSEQAYTGSDRHLGPGDPRVIYTKTGTWYFSDGTAEGTRQASSVPFEYREPDVRQTFSDLTLQNTITVGSRTFVVDNDVALIDDDAVVRVSPFGQLAVNGDTAIARGSYQFVNSITADGVRQENIEFSNASAVATLADNFWVASSQLDGSGDSALFRIDLTGDSVPAPAISGLESPNATRPAGRFQFSWAPGAGSPAVSSYDFVLREVTGPFDSGQIVDSLDSTADTSYERDFDPGNYRIQVRSRFNGEVSPWSEVFLQVSEPTAAAPTILTTTDEDTVFYDPLISWAAAPNAVSYETDSAVGITTGITSTSASVGAAHGDNSVRVRSRYADGTVSQWSLPFRFFAAAPPTVTNVRTDGTSVTVNLVPTREIRGVSYDVFDVDTGLLVHSEHKPARGSNDWLRFSVPYAGRYRLEMHSTVVGIYHSDTSEHTFDVEMEYNESQAFVSTVLNGNQLHVTWHHPNAETYDVRLAFNDDPIHEFEIIEDLAGLTATSRTFTLPADGQNFQVLVLARGSAGIGATITRRNVVATQVTRDRLRLTEGLGTQATGRPTFRWEPPAAGNPEVNRYELLIVGEGRTYRDAQITSTSHTIQEALTRGRYRVYLRAHFADGSTSPWGYHHGVVDLQPTVTASTVPPEIFSPAAAVASLRPVIRWEASAVASRYEVWLSTETDITPIIHETQLTSSSLTPSENLSPGRYRLWVRTHYEDGTKTKWTDTYRFAITQNDVVQITSGIGTQPPGTQTIGWTGISDAASYEIYVNDVNSRQTPVYRQAGISGTSHVIGATLQAGRSYEIWVRAHRADGTKTRWGNSPPLLQVQADISGVRPQLQVNGNTATWSSIAGANRYELWVNEVDPQNPNQTIAARVFHDSLATTSQNLDLVPGTYRGWLRAASADGSRSLWSDAVTFVIS